ncbi:MFS transporter [Streptomyces sp. NPDC057638]|uniref:MFS transporter n=1 Tax=Streptomyces sp. NPDC057638 TaxID=3346190 RepID=UPI00367EEEF9
MSDSSAPVSDSPAPVAMTGLLAPLRHRPFRRLATGRTLNHLANAMAPIILAFAVLDLTGSAVTLGLVVGARSVATVLLVLFGGLLADRLPRPVILQGASAGAALAQAAVAAVLLLGSSSVPLLIVLSVLNGAMSAVSMPATAALVPLVAPKGMLRSANAVTRMGVNLGVIVGASLGGLLASLITPAWGMVVNAAVFACAGVAYHGIRLPSSPADPDGPEPSPARPLAELREGWREFTARTWVWVVVAQFFVVNAVTSGGIHVLGPSIADDSFGRTAWGLVLATQMLGAFVGGFVVARSRSRHMLRVGVAVIALDVLPLIALAEAAPLALLVVAMFVNGMAIEQFGVAWDLSLQENVPPDRLARVYSYDILGSLLALPLGEMAAGPLAERFGTRETLLGGALLCLAATGAALCSRQVRNLTVRPARVITQGGADDADPTAGPARAPEGERLDGRADAPDAPGTA